MLTDNKAILVESLQILTDCDLRNPEDASKVADFHMTIFLQNLESLFTPEISGDIAIGNACHSFILSFVYLRFE
jgi:hypothetical protein